MTTHSPAVSAFHEGDEVVLAQGTPGVFLGLKRDAGWADIKEPDGSVRSHPLAWLAHAVSAIPASTN